VALVVADGHNGRESSGEAVAAVARRVGGLRFPSSVDLFIDVFWDAQEAVRNATQRPGAPNPESRTALALAVIGDTEVFWASMGDGDVFLCDRTIEPLSPRRSYFLGWPMTRAELADRLETGNTAVPDGAVVVVASDGLRDFADPSAEDAHSCCRCWPTHRTPRSRPRGLSISPVPAAPATTSRSASLRAEPSDPGRRAENGSETVRNRRRVGDTQPVITFMHDRGGRDTVFRLPDGQVARTGAAGTRCFRDISAQFSEDDALTTAEAAIALMPQIDRETPGIRRPQVAGHEIAVVTEAFLVAAGLSHDRAHELAQRVYRSGKTATANLPSFGFRPPCRW